MNKLQCPTTEVYIMKKSGSETDSELQFRYAIIIKTKLKLL